MPVCEVDPWRIQYFASARCPADVRIPTEDYDLHCIAGHMWMALLSGRRPRACRKMAG